MNTNIFKCLHINKNDILVIVKARQDKMYGAKIMMMVVISNEMTLTLKDVMN